ncbi:MAG: c-type cytochrome [Bacteroidia bacterium]
MKISFQLLVCSSLAGLFFFACNSTPKTEVVQTATENPVNSQEHYEKTKSNKGEALFKMHCTSCHKVETALIGPALKGVGSKYDEAWLLAFIRNAPKMIAEGDKRAVAVYNEYGKQTMTAFEFLTDDEIKAIVEYAGK